MNLDSGLTLAICLTREIKTLDIALRRDERSSIMEKRPARHATSSNSRRNEFMRKMITTLMALALIALPALAADDSKETDRLENAGTVMEEILNVPDDIPQDLLDKAECVVVFPSVLKAAFIVGGSYGRGTMVCRTGEHFRGPWGAPAMYALEGGSVGLQIGGEATDFVILVMNDRGMDSLLHSKVKLGADATVAAGPKGRTASADTDAYMRSEMLSYSRA